MRARSQLVGSWAVEINEHLPGNLLNRQKGAVLFGVSNGFATERSARDTSSTRENPCTRLTHVID